MEHAGTKQKTVLRYQQERGKSQPGAQKVLGEGPYPVLTRFSLPAVPFPKSARVVEPVLFFREDPAFSEFVPTLLSVFKFLAAHSQIFFVIVAFLICVCFESVSCAMLMVFSSLVLMFVFPFALIIYFPIEVLIFNSYSPYLISLLIILVSIIFFTLSIIIWNLNIRKYESSGS